MLILHPAAVVTGIVAVDESEETVEVKVTNHIIAMPRKVAPLGEDRGPVENGRVKLFLEVVGVLELFLGVLVIVLNILFIYFGINSGWYYSKDSLGTELKVISIGEGIIAGFFYILFAIVFLVKLSTGRSITILMYILNILMTLISFTLILTNACQIGLVSWYVPRTTSAMYPEQEVKLMDKMEKLQMVVLSLQLVAHMGVMVSAVGAMLGLVKLFTGKRHTYSPLGRVASPCTICPPSETPMPSPGEVKFALP